MFGKIVVWLVAMIGVLASGIMVMGTIASLNNAYGADLTTLDRFMSLRTIGFVVTRLPLHHHAFWVNPDSGNEGYVRLVREFDRSIPVGAPPRQPSPEFNYDPYGGSRVWLPVFGNPQKTRQEFCRVFEVHVRGFQPETHTACHTNQNTWIVDQQWILNSFEQSSGSGSCQRIYFNIRLDRPHTTEGTFCRVGETRWQAYP